MRRYQPIAFFALAALLSVGLFHLLQPAAAQDATATAAPNIVGPVTLVTATPTLSPQDDPRTIICSAPDQPGFVPHLVRPGDRLADLLTGVLNLTATQAAALNCLDDSAALPVGSVIWLPETVTFETTQPHDADPSTDKATIQTFTASADSLQNTAALTFTWNATGSAAYFYPCNPDPQAACSRPASTQPLPLRYTTPEISNFRYAGDARYRLEIVDGEASTTQDVTIEITCAQPPLGQYNGLTPCPDAPAMTVSMVWQPFEHGLMIWSAETKQIWVLTDDHQLQVVIDLYREGDAEPTDQAPDGLFVPQRGFGRVWSDLGGAESTLGWATAAETGVEVRYQPAGRVSYTTYYQFQDEDGARYAVTLLPGHDQGWWAALE